MNKQELRKLTKYIFLYAGYTLKAIWYATLNIVSLLVYVIGLGMMFLYLYDTGRIETLITYESIMNLIRIMFDYWRVFWLAFFGTNLYENLKNVEDTKEVTKK